MGFRCAYSVRTGRCGCSEIGLRAIRRFGVVGGFCILHRRMFLCGVTHRRFSGAVYMGGSGHYQQAGFIDLDCALPIDASCCDGLHVSDAVSRCDVGSCDWPDRKKRNQERERYVYIPPNSMRRATRRESA